jgi:hypothetical protein
MKNWKLIAAASNFDIPEAEVERIAPVLDALEAAFRPLVEEIPLETEPVTVFLPGGQP